MEETKKQPRKFHLSLTALVLLVLAAAWLLAGDKKDHWEKYAVLNHSVVLEDRYEELGQVFARQDGVDLGAVDGYLGDMSRDHSLDWSAAAFEAIRPQEDGSYLHDLYRMENGKLTYVSEGTLGHRMALSGDALAFFRQTDPENYKGGDLCLYRDGKTEVIVPQIRDVNPLSGLQISPDGTKIAFREHPRDCFYYDGENTYNLGRGIYCTAVTDDGLLYLGDSIGADVGHLYVQQGGDNESRVDLGEGIFLRFNRDLSQVIYSERTWPEKDIVSWQDYVLVDGREKHPVGTLGEPLLPRGTQFSVGYGKPRVLGVDSFANTFFRSGKGAITRIDESFQSRVLAEHTDIDAYLCGDGRTLYYVDLEREELPLCRLDGLADNAKPEVVLKDGGEWFAMDDGRSFYYADEDYRLMYQEGNKKPVLVTEWYEGGYAASGNTLLYFTFDDIENREAADQKVTWEAAKYWLAVDGKAREVLRIEGHHADWPFVRLDSSRRNPYGFTLRILDQEDQEQNYYFDQPWKYEELWKKAK